MSDTHQYNASRFEQKPIPQPSYSFGNVPKCAKNLEDSCLQRVTDRDHFKEIMAEMVLLCNEAVRRNKFPSEGKKKTSSKPLNLEYIADRLDVDDPISGYLVRSKGRLQGFVTVTTFTNWQRTFRWDSMHESAYSYDDEEHAKKQRKGIRKYDRSGKLAESLQATVRCGDPWNEGIVWPRIAEISLLGGLGCGKALISLVIEELECMKASGTQNYDYVVLQATENSIPFYESLGFVRVGAITEDIHFGKGSPKDNDEDTTITEGTLTEGTITDTDGTRTDDDVEAVVAIPVEDDQKDQNEEKTDKKGMKKRVDSVDEEDQTMPEIVSSPLITYKTTKIGETPNAIAKMLGHDVWDIIFLNQPNMPNITPRSRLIKKTEVLVPDKDKALEHATSSAIRRCALGCKDSPQAPLWFIAKENDTPRTIAKKFDLSWKDIVKGNLDRLPELESNSRLRQGTRVKVSHFDVPDDRHVPYCHWTFPDDKFESCDPSYMMALKLNRCADVEVSTREFHSSLAVPISSYERTPLLLPASPVRSDPKSKVQYKGGGKHPDEPKPPKKPLSAYKMFCRKQRELLSGEHQDMSAPEVSTALNIAWKELPDVEKVLYTKASEKALIEYDEAADLFRSQLAEFKAKHPEYYGKNWNDLFCKVVKLSPQAATENSEFTYWFVLTFIPDLKWCHLAPLRQDGLFKNEYPSVLGRPKWKLVDESLGKEIDISSRLVIPVEASTIKQSDDADEEEWDIVEVRTPIEGRELKRSFAAKKKKRKEKKRKMDKKNNEEKKRGKKQKEKGSKVGAGPPSILGAKEFSPIGEIEAPAASGHCYGERNTLSKQSHVMSHGASNWVPPGTPSWAVHPTVKWAPPLTSNCAPQSASNWAPRPTPDFRVQPTTNWGARPVASVGVPFPPMYAPTPAWESQSHARDPAANIPPPDATQPPNVSPQESNDRSCVDSSAGKQWGSGPIRSANKLPHVAFKSVQPSVQQLDQNRYISHSQSTILSHFPKRKKGIPGQSGSSNRYDDAKVDLKPVVSVTQEHNESGSDSSTLSDPDITSSRKRPAPVSAGVSRVNKVPKTVPNMIGSNALSLPNLLSITAAQSPQSTPSPVQQSDEDTAISDGLCVQQKQSHLMGEYISRKARTVNSAGSCRSVLQN